jgi:hypothetical protein
MPSVNISSFAQSEEEILSRVFVSVIKAGRRVDRQKKRPKWTIRLIVLK